MLLWAAANRDPEQFAEPDRCVLDRSPNEHVTFGRGIHRCIGIDLARLEIRIAVEELLARTGWFEPRASRSARRSSGRASRPCRCVSRRERQREDRRRRRRRILDGG